MKHDPIVEEVRDAARHLTEEAGNDVHRLCEMLREREKEHADRLTERAPQRPSGPRRTAARS